jgi:DNA polymerase III epsilon subunit-like protein
MKTHIMIDLETLDVKPTASILTIGAVKFDPLGEELVRPEMDSFYTKIDLDSCDKYNLTVDDSTILWWSQQSVEAQAAAFDETDRVSIEDAMQNFYKFCWGATHIWSHGSGFDIVILENVFAKVGRAVPWKFWQARDSRTIFDLGINPNRPPVTKHHALEDAWNQAVGVQNVCRELRTRNITPFIRTDK